MTAPLAPIVTPVAAALLVLAGLILGGPWLVAAFAFLLAFTIGLPPGANPSRDDPSAPWLPVLLGLLHFAILFAAILSLAAARAPAFLVGGFATAGLYLGQVSNPAAHELIHRSDRAGFLLGKWVYISMLFGHHSSAHRLVHHVHVATGKDPNSARRGESLYRFLPRAWAGSFRAGLAAERARAGGRFPWASYGPYLLGAAALVALSAVLAGPPGAALHLALAGWATVQLLTSDYVQHYGLSRKTGPDGRAEPVGPQHSWDAPQRGPALLMLNAPRHAAHHLRPADGYGKLAISGPRLPRSLAVMGFVAFFPRWWRRVMDPRLPAG